jgi:hypothetical protein
MPISRLTITAALAAAFVCGVPLSSLHAADLDDEGALEADADMRDLRPAPAKPGGGAARRPLVTLRPSSDVVPVGAPISFEVGSSVNGYGHMYVISASGRVQVWMENAPISAGERLTFPAGGPGIEAAAPPGREELMLVVTRDRIDGFLGHKGTRTPRLLDLRPEAFKRELTAKFGDIPHRHWGYARTSVQVVNRTPAGPSWGWEREPEPGAPRRSDPWPGQWDTD